MFSATGLALTSLMALSASAAPAMSKLSARQGATFNIQLKNNCGFDKEFGLYQITSDYQMVQRSDPVSLPPGGTTTIVAPFNDIGMRLSGHAEWDLGSQWNAQALFEFGYSNYGTDGTAYDLSVMQGSDGDIGISCSPIDNGNGSGTCESKQCWPWNCPEDQGWTNPDQVNDGSPADTVCYHGTTDFQVTYCP